MASSGEMNAKQLQDAVVSTVLMSFATLADSSAVTELFFNRRRRSHRNIILAAAVACGKDFRADVIPRFSDASFRRHFRISRSTFEHVLELTSASAGQVPSQTEALLSLWVLGNAESFGAVAERFRLNSRSQARDVFLHFCSTVSGRSPDFVQWPRGLQAVRTRHDFGRLQLADDGDGGDCETPPCNIPDVIGCIGTMHLRLGGERPHARGTRRQTAANDMALQIVCDTQLQITDVYAGFSRGSDAIWQVADFCESSPLWKDLLSSSVAVPANCHLLGDASFPLRSTLLTPYIVPLNADRRMFNRALRATRAVTVERTLARLLGRFRACLRDNGLSAVPYEDASRVVLASCVLHNLCVTLGDRTPEVDRNVPVASAAAGQHTADAEGVRKRDELASRMMRRADTDS